MKIRNLKFATLLVITIVFGGCVNNQKEATEGKAYFHSQKCVKERLKSPATADFPYTFKSRKDGEKKWTIVGNVDSENSFGATIRTKYMVTMEYKNGKWSCSNLVFI